MAVTEVRFLLFVLASVIVYYLTPGKWRWLILLGASAVFYVSQSLRAALYLAVTVLFTYCFSLWLHKLAAQAPAGETPEQRRRDKARLKRKKRLVLSAALGVNFLTLAVLKYAGFAVESYNSLSRLWGGAALPVPSFFLPLGLSFYIFQTSGYLIDISRRQYAPQRNLGKYALFACYFPQLVQGPINRYPALGKTLFAGDNFSWENIQRGLLRMMEGMIKKALIADALAGIVQSIYSGYAGLPGALCFLGAGLYGIQLYFDFSGGIDLLSGVSELFGVPMAENFRQPYFASSLADFWRRWHISLGQWMKDYLFYPLALSKGFGRIAKAARAHLSPAFAKRVVPCLSTVAVFLAVGLWQGPGWANIAYGLWNGLWMSLGILWTPVSDRVWERLRLSREAPAVHIWGIIRTNVLVIFGRYFSHAASLSGAIGMLRQTFLHPGFSSLSGALFAELGVTPFLLVRLTVLWGIFFIVSLARERGVDTYQWFCARGRGIQFLLLFACLLLLVFGVYANAEYTPVAYVYANI